MPGSVAQITYDGLNNKTGHGSRQPKARNIFRFGAEEIIDHAHISHLQRPPELYPEKPETHVPDLPEIGPRLCLHGAVGFKNERGSWFHEQSLVYLVRNIGK